jgi:hypothetical protein
MALRKLARSIVAARAERAARAAGNRVKAPGAFRRYMFGEGWAKAQRTWYTQGPWKPSSRTEVSR